MTSHEPCALPDEELRLEALLADLAVRFAGVLADAIDAEIESAQARLCRCLGLDLCTLWQRVAGSAEAYRLTHYWHAPGGGALIEQSHADNAFPRFRKQLAAGAVVAVSSMDTLPPEASADAELSRRYGIKSTLALPLPGKANEVEAFLFFNTLHAEHIWPDSLIERLRAFARTFAALIARRRCERPRENRQAAPLIADDSADAGLWSFNLATKTFAANAKAREIHGLAPDAALTWLQVALLIDTDDQENLRRTLVTVPRSRREEVCEYRVRGADGSVRWIASRVRAHHASDGETDFVTGISLDVTGRKRDDAQAAEEARLDALIGELATRFVVVSSDRVDDEIRQAQQRVCACAGLDHTTVWQNEVFADSEDYFLVSLYRREVGSPPQRDVASQGFFPWARQQLIAGKTIILPSLAGLPPEAAIDAESLRAYGTRSTLMFPIATSGGEVFGFVTFATRLAEREWPPAIVERLRRVAEIIAAALWRRRSELSLRESKERLRLAMESAGAGLWSIDLETRRVWASPRMNELLPHPDERCATMMLQDILSAAHPDDREALRDAIREAIDSDAPLLTQYRVLLPDGSVRWLSVRGQRHCNAAGKAERLTGISIDITEQKASEADKRLHFAELAHMNRVSTAGELTTSLAHELNQPLGAILRNAEAAEIILRDDYPDLEDLRAIVADIQKADQRAGEVIDRLRLLLKRRNTELQALDLSRVVDEVVSLVRSDALGRRIRIETFLSASLPPVLADRVHLQQVMINLMMNGMDAIDNAPGGEQQRLIVRAGLTRDGMVEVAVSDSGCGLLPEVMSRGFEPFFTTKSGGMGMGLAISRTIVEAHGGRIWADNNATRGATFHFTLQRAEGDVPQRARDEALL